MRCTCFLILLTAALLGTITAVFGEAFEPIPGGMGQIILYRADKTALHAVHKCFIYDITEAFSSAGGNLETIRLIYIKPLMYSRERIISLRLILMLQALPLKCFKSFQYQYTGSPWNLVCGILRGLESIILTGFYLTKLSTGPLLMHMEN